MRWQGRTCVLRLPSPSGIDLNRYAQIIRWVGSHGVPVAAVLEEGPEHLLLEYLPGEPAGAWAGAHVPVSRIQAAFRVLAALHRDVPMPPAGVGLTEDSWSPYVLPAMAASPGGAADGPDFSAMADEGGRVLCHGDFHPDNVIYEEDEVRGLVDFEYAQITFAEYDLAYGVLTFCGRWPRGELHPAHAAAALRAYGAIRPPHAQRLQHMFPVAALALRAWCKELPPHDPRRDEFIGHLDGLLRRGRWPEAP